LHICIDFDGVCTDGPGGGVVSECPDMPTTGVFQFIENAIREGFVVSVFSWRSGDERGIEAMRLWFMMNGCSPDIVEWPTSKPNASVFMDSKSYRFKGEWPNVHCLRLLRAWYQKI
jgi:hypothetical protein